ncbi:AMP-binding enzyme domain-containing protein [Trichoderma breve]|uniref:AMP-binding enzyme domain-containing protein n=1 Tax=Trichoderma breve TaxID=2034170 RepID=A0A9W9B9Z9_9HYPO|nr:AMP-binding enzyme domain-containing protein [Trichoderma breve]KAJ4857439.1 AMP-binding enzyme domain-containing protein [Trichoderma breve]
MAIDGDGNDYTGSAKLAIGMTASPEELKKPTVEQQKELWAWNQHVPSYLQRCMHDIITEKSQQQPDKIAVESWDGSLTYEELDSLSSQLARQILQRNAGAGSRIPLCFEKSMWTVVAVLAVMKAGATFSLTDPSQPVARLQTIVEQTGANLVITSVAQSGLGIEISREGGQVLAISRDYFDGIKEPELKQELPQVSAETPMYIIFTSGSTGKPKGVVITHCNYTSGAIPRAEAVGYKSTSRCFDFPSYAFDVSIDCMLCTLAAGGQICVPSEEGRMNDLSGAIRQSKANMVHMTPSVARVLDSDIIPSLDVLGLGGEAVSASDAAAWSQHTSLIIAYGPSECTVGCTINNTVTISTGIGKGVGGVTWIVDPDDHNILMPVGAVGELIIEGPVVGVGYLDEQEKTAEVFIEDPSWLVSGHSTFPGRPGRLYKTGDLVRYESNGSGSIEFVGRKDQQVKLRGQRVELTEVEHHLRACLPSGIKVAAEVIKPENGGAPSLVAFLSESISAGASGVDPAIVEPSSELKAALATVNEAMGARVPRYMVPAAFVTLQHMPSLVSGKTDRKKLREIGAAIPRDVFSRMQATEVQEEEDPETETEKKLQQAWTKVLGSDANIYRQSNFFALGGDSLRAMRLVVTAREQGISLTVADIFTNPTLSGMASKATQASESSLDEIPPFSLLEEDWDLESARNEMSTLCGVEASAVEDAYPCTPLQEALMALSAKVKEAYVAQRVVELKDVATAEKLIEAFDIVQQDSPILRTRIVQIPGRGLVQVVIKEKLNKFSGTNLDEYLVNDRNDTMELGKNLVRYALIDDATTGKVSFVLTIHHALYDGWSMPLVVDRVNQAYSDQISSRPAQFKHFIKYLSTMDMRNSANYWRDQLSGTNPSQFPPLPWQGYQPQADSLLEQYIPLEDGKASNATTATIIRAAWALVASQYINSTDVVFGETLTGRNAPVIGSEEIEGPMITTVPVRVQIDRDMHISDYLQSIQEQVVDQIPHEHFGLQHIRKLSPDAYDACELRTGLVLHPTGDAEAAQEALKFNTYPLMLVCSIDPRGFLVMASFDSKTVSVPVMERALDQFKQIAQLLCKQGSSTLSSLQSSLTNTDAEELRGTVLNADVSEAAKEFTGIQAAYVTDSKDPNILVPVFAVGELIVQHPDELPNLTEISPPIWIESVSSSAALSQGRFYRTGRLAKYDSTQKPVHIKLVDSYNERNAQAPQVGVAKSRISASSSRQRKLRSLWARVLRMSEEDIGLNDGFFVLGGDSIAAMKLVSEARVEGIKLTVVQIFQKRTLYEMASAMEEVEKPASSTDVTATPEDKLKPFSLLNLQDEGEKLRFVNDTIAPQLADSTWRINNVLPTRPLQQIAVRGTTQLPRFSARYEIMYFDKVINKEKMVESCNQLVARNEILRTVFTEHQDEGYAVVLEELVPSFVEYAIDSDVEAFAQQLCRLDAMTRMPLGSSFVKWFLVESTTGQSCLIFRLSHAQYDEICLPIMLQQLSSLYQDQPVQETVPFSAYVHHVLGRNLPESIPYWTDLLSGSSLTVLKPDIPVQQRNHFAIQHTVDISSRLRDITVASLPTAAWALCLARRLSLRDVTFGEVVSGRNIDFSHGPANAITGPCWQYIPVRVRFPPGCTALQVLSAVQHQHIASSAHEGISLSEIATLCGTSWLRPDGPKASDLWFDSVVHQDVEHVENLAFAAAGSGRLETLYVHEEPLREWKIQAFVHDNSNKLTLEIVTFESWGGYARELLDDLVDAVASLLKNPHARLFENESE